MKKPTLFLIILVAIFFTSTLVLLYLNYLKPKSPSTVGTISIETPTVIPTPDPTADWKTYENTKQGFSFRYPSDWFLDNDTVSEHPWPFDGPFDPKYDFQKTYNAIFTYVYPNHAWFGMSNSVFFDSLSQVHLYDTGNTGQNVGKKILTGVTQDNFPYQIFEVKNSPESDEPYNGVEAYILNGQKLVKMVLDSYNEQGILIFNQILSTFKFTQ